MEKVKGVKQIWGFQTYQTTKFKDIRINPIKRNLKRGL